MLGYPQSSSSILDWDFPVHKNHPAFLGWISMTAESPLHVFAMVVGSWTLRVFILIDISQIDVIHGDTSEFRMYNSTVRNPNNYFQNHFRHKSCSRQHTSYVSSQVFTGSRHHLGMQETCEFNWQKYMLEIRVEQASIIINQQSPRVEKASAIKVVESHSFTSLWCGSLPRSWSFCRIFATVDSCRQKERLRIHWWFDQRRHSVGENTIWIHMEVSINGVPQ